MTSKYRYQADDSVVCEHRDISCCPACLAADPNLVDVFGTVWEVKDVAERESLLALVG